MKAVYPVIFTQTDTNVLVEVPDLEILTEGTDIADAVEMARDAIGVTGISMQDHNEEIPQAPDIRKIDVNTGTFFDAGKSIVSLVDIDFDAYRRKNDMKAVRRNVTLPNWLNTAAEAAHINVSKLLQDALMEKLGVSR